MIKFSRNDPIDLEKFEERINHKNYVLVDEEKMYNIYKYESSRLLTVAELTRNIMAANSALEFSELSRDAVYYYLQEVEGVDPNRFSRGRTAGFSLDASKILEPMLAQGIAKEFLTSYIAYSSIKSRTSRIKNVLDLLYNKGDKGVGGISISRLNFTVNQQENLRYNYKNTDLISIPEEYNSCYTVEDGYLLVWGDFAQSDFRIAYNLLIRDDRNAKIMDKYEDKYEGMARILADYFKEEFDYDKFKAERDLFKVYVLQTVYGQRKGDTAEAHAFITKFAEYLETCPKYVEFKRRIQDRVRLDLPIPVTSYFGFDQLVPLDRGRGKDPANKCLNTPIQTGTSEIIILTVNKILDMFYELGYTEDDVSLYMNRHDEPVFKIRKEVLKDAWVFKNASEILVDNWTSLKMTFEYGYHYTERNNELQALAEKSYEENKHRLEVVYPEKDVEEYWPVPQTFVIYTGRRTVGDKTVICLYNATEHKAAYMLCASTNNEEIYNTMKSKVLDSQNDIYRQGYRGVVLYTDLAREELHDQLMFYKVSNTTDNGKLFADILSRLMALRYAKREGIPHEEDMSLFETNASKINSVGDLDVIQK